MNRVTAVISVFALSLLISACNSGDGQAPQTGTSDTSSSSQIDSALNEIGEKSEATLSEIRTEGAAALSEIRSETEAALSAIDTSLEEGAEKAADELGLGDPQ